MPGCAVAAYYRCRNLKDEVEVVGHYLCLPDLHHGVVGIYAVKGLEHCCTEGCKFQAQWSAVMGEGSIVAGGFGHDGGALASLAHIALYGSEGVGATLWHRYRYHVVAWTGVVVGEAAAEHIVLHLFETAFCHSLAVCLSLLCEACGELCPYSGVAARAELLVVIDAAQGVGVCFRRCHYLCSDDAP